MLLNNNCATYFAILDASLMCLMRWLNSSSERAHKIKDGLQIAEPSTFAYDKTFCLLIQGCSCMSNPVFNISLYLYVTYCGFYISLKCF